MTIMDFSPFRVTRNADIDLNMNRKTRKATSAS